MKRLSLKGTGKDFQQIIFSQGLTTYQLLRLSLMLSNRWKTTNSSTPGVVPFSQKMVRQS
jgi:hypothetical protein